MLLSVLLLLPATAAISVDPVAASAPTAGAFQDVPATHWGVAHIRWAADNGIISGDGNGLFRPQDPVTEPEFLAMLTQSYPSEIAVPRIGPNNNWYAPYYLLAEEFSWPLTYKTTGNAFTRGDVAKLITSAIGVNAETTEEAVRYLLGHGLANGKTANTVAGYNADDPLNRAEAVSFLHNLRDQRTALLDESKADFMTLLGISLGDSEAAVKKLMGEPNREDPSGYGFTWYIYNKNLAKYAQFGFSNGKVVAMFSNAPGVWKLKSGGAVSGTKAEAANRAGQSLDESENEFSDTGHYVRTTYYFDKHADNRVEGILQASNSAVLSSLYNRSEALERAMERQVLDMTNVFRYKYKVASLKWDSQVAEVARAHSADMSKRTYFNHNSPEGLTPFDRMEAQGLNYLSAGENIASGYEDAPSVHTGWINSLGHRKNILEPAYTRLGVGIDGLNYTQDFYTPMP